MTSPSSTPTSLSFDGSIDPTCSTPSDSPSCRTIHDCDTHAHCRCVFDSNSGKKCMQAKSNGKAEQHEWQPIAGSGTAARTGKQTSRLEPECKCMSARCVSTQRCGEIPQSPDSMCNSGSIGCRHVLCVCTSSKDSIHDVSWSWSSSSSETKTNTKTKHGRNASKQTDAPKVVIW